MNVNRVEANQMRGGLISFLDKEIIEEFREDLNENVPILVKYLERYIFSRINSQFIKGRKAEEIIYIKIC